ncbi:MAG: hypothetical protein ACI4UI_09125 [Levilactobacillus brevis]
MWVQHQSGTKRQGWLLPDALLALSIVALTVTTAQHVLLTTEHLARQRQEQLTQARYRHDQALLAWAEAQP